LDQGPDPAAQRQSPFCTTTLELVDIMDAVKVGQITA